MRAATLNPNLLSRSAHLEDAKRLVCKVSGAGQGVCQVARCRSRWVMAGLVEPQTDVTPSPKP